MKILLALLLLTAVHAKSQKVIENEIDKFTKQHRVRTDRILVKGGLQQICISVLGQLIQLVFLWLVEPAMVQM
jgi:DNA-binding PucR family transcriptional regulator